MRRVLVDKRNELVAGEADRAAEWGARLAEVFTAVSWPAEARGRERVEDADPGTTTSQACAVDSVTQCSRPGQAAGSHGWFAPKA
jgi:hypothetical protein